MFAIVVHRYLRSTIDSTMVQNVFASVEDAHHWIRQHKAGIHPANARWHPYGLDVVYESDNGGTLLDKQYYIVRLEGCQ